MMKMNNDENEHYSKVFAAECLYKLFSFIFDNFKNATESSLFHIKITASVTKTSHQDRAIYTHLIFSYT